MTTPRTAHRRTSGSIRHLSSGSWQARYTGPDGALRTLGTFPTKVEADQVLAHETSRMARDLGRLPPGRPRTGARASTARTARLRAVRPDPVGHPAARAGAAPDGPGRQI